MTQPEPVQRYFASGRRRRGGGPYVLYDDHLAAVRAAVERERAALLTEASRLRALSVEAGEGSAVYACERMESFLRARAEEAPDAS